MRPREAREPARKVRAFPDAVMPLGRNYSRIIAHGRAIRSVRPLAVPITPRCR